MVTDSVELRPSPIEDVDSHHTPCLGLGLVPGNQPPAIETQCHGTANPLLWHWHVATPQRQLPQTAHNLVAHDLSDLDRRSNALQFCFARIFGRLVHVEEVSKDLGRSHPLKHHPESPFLHPRARLEQDHRVHGNHNWRRTIESFEAVSLDSRIRQTINEPLLECGSLRLALPPSDSSHLSNLEIKHAKIYSRTAQVPEDQKFLRWFPWLLVVRSDCQDSKIIKQEGEHAAEASFSRFLRKPKRLLVENNLVLRPAEVLANVEVAPILLGWLLLPGQEGDVEKRSCAARNAEPLARCVEHVRVHSCHHAQGHMVFNGGATKDGVDSDCTSGLALFLQH
mmetsp:Transcript_65435/g.173428  ORF Transcript_65435/g.173428 Transcript_65435/m.173428 type:complete len:338 (-) Transcript_65435:129-1142(-)